MTALKKRVLVIAGVFLFIPATLYVGAWLLLGGYKDKPSNIVDFSPSHFEARAESKFFYSIRGELKYADEIDPQSPTLLRGEIKNFLVSPDSEKIAVVANGKLFVVGVDYPAREITTVDSIYREPKPIGTQFFRDDDFQWSEDSTTLYLIRDEYYTSKGSQLYSEKGELWRYAIESGNLELVLKPFRAYTYFFGQKSGIYFSVPTPDGDLVLQYFDGSHVLKLDHSSGLDIPHDRLAHGLVETPFYSFSIFDYQRMLSNYGVSLSVDRSDGPEKLIINGKPYLALNQGVGFKGPYYCSAMLRSVFLPGERYFLFNADYCGNYSGQLLIDTINATYETLPPKTVVYVTLNTRNVRQYRVTGGGIVI